MCDKTHSCLWLYSMPHSCVWHMWHDSFMCVTWLNLCATYVTWLIHVCNISGMTHSCVQHDSFMCVTYVICFIHVFDMCGMAHSSVWHMWLIHVCDNMAWLIHVCDTCGMAHSCVWHIWLIHVCDIYDSFMCVTYMTHSCVWHIWLIHVCDISCTAWLVHVCDMTRSCV